ncbi:MAG: hypothetical protein HY593_00635 [Candidatus Omnitrophica bacterium]|nr:hypothetical protein [Candidatus Omnitrophota bacterium]
MRACFWLSALFFLQNSFSVLFPFQTLPFGLLGVVYYGVSGGPFPGFLAGVWAGLFYELFAGQGFLGYPLIFFAGAGAFSGAAALKIFKESIFLRVALPLIASFAMAFFHLFLQGFSSQESFRWERVFFEGVRQSGFLWVMAAAPFVFGFLDRVSK